MYKLPKDKQGHMIAGLIIFVVIYFVTGVPSYALLAAAIVGAGKEICDATGRGTVEFLDFIATIAPGALLYLILN